MDVERIQKINSLAVELMKKGLATDRENAVVQAEQIYRNTDTEGYSSLRDTLREVKAEASPKKEIESAVDLSQDQIKEILEKNTKFLVSTIKDFQEKMGNMEKELESLKTKLRYQSIPTAKEIIVDAPQQASRPRPVEQPRGAPTTNTHPRSGNYNEQDVSIEKFFYMGSK
ncbi:hypothetical protein HYT55_01670 [Candidatus Woesearchaeota archaeon]|nr:hypothetical protein [Candidatus Woesearchaeota archaeon]